MSILCIDQFSNWGGGQRSLLDLLPAFRQRGWSPHIALPGDGPFAAELHRLNYSITRLRCGTYTSIRKPLREYAQYLSEMPQLTRQILLLARKSGASLLYVNGPRLLPPAAWVAKTEKLPLVFHCHHALEQSAAIFVNGNALRVSDSFVIACCRHAAKHLDGYVAPGRMCVRFNGVHGPVIPLRRSSSPICRIGVVGRIEPEKGQLAFVQAAHLVVREFPHCRFTVAGAAMFSGDRYFSEVVATSKTLPITFAGWIDSTARLFAELDLLVVPSSPMEATTRVILEAFAFGVPVVAFPSGGIPEIVTDNETGFLASGFTAADLAARIQSVLSMPAAEVRRVVDNARAAWSSRFTVDQYREAVCEILNQAGASRRTLVSEAAT